MARQAPPPSSGYECLAGAGEMGALMRSLDWSKTLLGPVISWPQSLRTSVSTCLNSRFAIVLWWGPELVMLYNDAYRDIIGAKHPQALGRPGRECWPEIWPTISPMLEGVLQRGEATWANDFLLPIERNGYLEECYFTFSYSPICNEFGGVGGVFTPVAETTEHVIGARRISTLRDLASRTSGARDVRAACEACAETLSENPYSLPFAALYLFDETRSTATLVGSTGVEVGSSVAPKMVAVPQMPTVLADAVKRAQMTVIHDLAAVLGPLPRGPWDVATRSGVVLPILTPGQDSPLGFVLAGTNPWKRDDTPFRTFLELVGGQISSAVANARAYDEERQRAQALAEIDRAKTAFFSNVSHEFRTPLTLMLGPIEAMLERAQPSGANNLEELQLVHRNCLRLQRMVNTLLDFSRIEAGRLEGKFEPSDLAALTADYASVFRSIVTNAGLYFDVQVDTLGEPVYVDRSMWEKIVHNLLSNAFKFTLTGGIRLRLKRNRDVAELTIADTGVGIPEPNLPRIFERFYRVEGSPGRSFEGTGIGLSLVHELVKLHEGLIMVHSEVNRGTEFTVSIPLGTAHLRTTPGRIGTSHQTSIEPRIPVTEPQSREVVGPLSRDFSQTIPAVGQPPPVRLMEDQARIVLADDNADMRTYISRMLASWYEVEAVSDGQEALAAVLRKRADLVLTDVMMPRMNGMELLQELRKNQATATIPVIMLSAKAEDESLLEGLEAGADDYVIKPFSAAQLLARVRSHVTLARLREEAKAAVARSEARLRQLLEAAPEAILEVNAEGQILLVNEAAEQMFGYSREELLALNVDALLPEAQRENYAQHRHGYAQKPERRAMGSGLQLDAQRKDGSPVPVEISLSPNRSADAFTVIALVRDITERRRAEAQLEANRAQLVSSSRLASLGVMAGGIAHEINNPLAIIHASADELVRRAKREGVVSLDSVVRNGERIQQTARRITTIIKSMRLLAREGSHDRFCLTPVSRIVEEALELCKERFKHHSVNLLLPSIDPTLSVSCREAQIARVLVNLLQNAFDAVMEDEEERWIRLDVRVQDDAVVFSVIDSGPGVPPELKARIMEPFFTTKDVGKGTGLGLSLSRKIVEEHRGNLAITEEAGHTCFSFDLPLSLEMEGVCN